MKRILIINHVFVFVVVFGFGQTSIDALGGSIKSTKYSFTYSLGEIATTTIRNNQSTIFATSGVIQPEIIIGTKINDDKIQSFAVYPNPVRHELNFYPVFEGSCPYTLLSMDGLYISRGNIFNNRISVEHLGSGAYILKLNCNKDKKFYNFILKL